MVKSESMTSQLLQWVFGLLRQVAMRREYDREKYDIVQWHRYLKKSWHLARIEKPEPKMPKSD